MLRRLVTVIILIIFVGLVSAQDDFPEEYIFVDGTIVNFPSDFLVYDEDYDDMYMANASIDMRFFVVYERTIQSQELDSLPVILEWYFGDSDAYELGAEEAITIGEREGIRFSYKTDANIQRSLIVLPIGENGSVAVVTIQPNTDNVDDDTVDETLPLQIISTMRYENLGTSFETVLGNSFTFDEQWMIEYPDAWIANTIEQGLMREDVSLTVSVYSAEEISALELKNDPIELLYYDLFAPVDTSIDFDPTAIVFLNIRGLEGIRYRLSDTVAGETIQRVYFLAPLSETDVLAMEITAPVGSNILQDADVQDIIQTIRPDGTLPPIEMMAFDNAYILQDVGEIRFPAFWRLRDYEDTTIALSTLESNAFIVPFTSEFSTEQGYPDDLAGALLDIVSPLDESVVLNPDDIELGTLENGNAFAQTRYIETSDTRTYPRIVMVVLLDDNSLVFIGIVPQPGIEDITEATLNEARAIINTIVSQ
ncbi:MAG: hypothetical protein Phog2KO_36690 [Phototrophicaceae bacterium]